MKPKKEEKLYKKLSHFNNIDFSTSFVEIDIKNIDNTQLSRHENKVVDFCLSFYEKKEKIETGRINIDHLRQATLNKYSETSNFISRKIDFLREDYPKDHYAVIQFQNEYNKILEELKKEWRKNNNNSHQEYYDYLGTDKEKIFKQIFPLSKLYNFFYFINEVLSDGYSNNTYKIYTDIIEKISFVLNELFELNDYRKEEKKLEIISKWYKKNFLEQYKNRDINPIFFIKYILDNYKKDNEITKKTLEYYIDFYLRNSIYHDNLKDLINEKILLKILDNKKIKKIFNEKIKSKDVYNTMDFSIKHLSEIKNHYINLLLIQEIDEWNYFELDQQIIHQFSTDENNHLIFINWLEKFYPEKGIKIIDKIEHLINKEDKSLFAFTSISDNAFPIQKINKSIDETRKIMEKSAIKSNLYNKEKRKNTTINRF